MFYDSSNKPWLGQCVIITIFITMDSQLNYQQTFNSVANPYSLSDRTTINRRSWPFFLINNKNKNNNNNNNTWPKPSQTAIHLGRK